jgi:hypothetical protein
VVAECAILVKEQSQMNGLILRNATRIVAYCTAITGALAFAGTFKAELDEEIERRFPAQSSEPIKVEPMASGLLPFSTYAVEGSTWRFSGFSCESEHRVSCCFTENGRPIRVNIATRKVWLPIDDSYERKEQTPIEKLIEAGFPSAKRPDLNGIDWTYHLAKEQFTFGGFTFSR